MHYLLVVDVDMDFSFFQVSTINAHTFIVVEKNHSNSKKSSIPKQFMEDGVLLNGECNRYGRSPFLFCYGNERKLANRKTGRKKKTNWAYKQLPIIYGGDRR